MAGFSFGTNPATTNTGSFTFGSSATFGSGSTTAATGGLTFGTPNANVAPTGGLGAATAQPTGGFTFGSTSTPAAPVASTPGGLTFGAGGGAGGLTFKSPTTATATPAQNTGTGFSFGVTGQQPQLSFGGTPATTSVAPPATSGLSFFNTPTSLTAAPQTSIGFGTTPQLGTTTAGSLFATPSTAQAGLTFNAPTSSTAAKPSTLPVLSFGGTTTAATTANTAGGLSFGFSTPAAKTTATTGFTLGAPSTGATGIFGFPSATTSAVPGTTATATPAPVFKGLGGVDTTQNTTGIGGGPAGGTGGRSENKTAKENQVPNDFIQSIEAYKSFVKTQKNLSCEVARASVKPMAKVTADTQALQQLLSTLSANIQKNNMLADRLKLETSKGFALYEMAQRTHDTPAGLQNDNTAPFEFFINLVGKFEQNVQILRQEIDNTEKHVNTLSQSSVLAPQELSMALKRLHESFVALAGRLQVIHQSVVTQRERHLSLRRHFMKDATDIFAKTSGDVNKKSGVAAGPTPFSAMGTVQTLGMLASQDKTISSFPGGTATVPGWGTTQTANPVPSLGSTGTSFIGSPSFSTTTDNSNFQLLKPPPGNKRGKR